MDNNEKHKKLDENWLKLDELQYNEIQGGFLTGPP